ncbi:MAG: class A beta-lactamase-related serine hydrolase [Bacteroidota bacterium]|nr:class A beta-lactamase-related serine hydrolase [Bacteroidota bacterium]
MKSSIPFVLLFFMNTFAVLTYGQPKLAIQILKQQIIEELAKQKGTFAVAFEDISANNRILINDQEIFHAASTMKTPVMIEVFKQVAEGKFYLNDSMLIKNEFKSIVDSSSYSLDSADDSETEIYRHIGEKRTLYQLMYDMIIASSNLSTNLIIEKVGAKNVTNTMRDLGAKKIEILRGVEDNKAFDKGMNNTTTAFDLMVIFEKIAKGKAVSRKASGSMIKILLDQIHNEVMPANLPKEVKVAHKTGSLTGVHHDSGIVFLPDGRKYVLVLLSKNLEDESAAVKAMAHVSEMIYEWYYLCER